MDQRVKGWVHCTTEGNPLCIRGPGTEADWIPFPADAAPPPGMHSVHACSWPCLDEMKPKRLPALRATRRSGTKTARAKVRDRQRGGDECGRATPPLSHASPHIHVEAGRASNRRRNGWGQRRTSTGLRCCGCLRGARHARCIRPCHHAGCMRSDIQLHCCRSNRMSEMGAGEAVQPVAVQRQRLYSCARQASVRPASGGSPSLMHMQLAHACILQPVSASYNVAHVLEALFLEFACWLTRCL